MHAAVPGIAPRMRHKLYFQPLSGLQSSLHSRDPTSCGAVRQRVLEVRKKKKRKKREEAVQRQRRNVGFCLNQLSIARQLIPKQRLTEINNVWTRVSLRSHLFALTQKGERSRMQGCRALCCYILKGKAPWHLVLPCDVLSSPGPAAVPAVDHYTPTPLGGLPTAWLRFNYTQSLDPPKKARTINLSSLQENEKCSPITCRT